MKLSRLLLLGAMIALLLGMTFGPAASVRAEHYPGQQLRSAINS